jgi:hypothetical protein
MSMSTSFQDFVGAVCDDKRAATLDPGNVKLTFNSLMVKTYFVTFLKANLLVKSVKYCLLFLSLKITIVFLQEKVENKEKERLKEENR